MRVAVIGTGLIGGSIGLALARAGTAVCGYDAAPERLARAVERGAVTEPAGSVAEAARGSDAVFVAVPVGRVAALAVEALDAGAKVVTDVGSVKASVVAEVEASRPDLAGRFVGGHPMAGSEQDGPEGADEDLFDGATWVLTPTARTDPTAHAAVRGLVAQVGAEIVELAPEQHDALVAVVSHVPQLAATTLMDVAAGSGAGARHAVLLRLAAGGFRDMTRIAAGHPGIWPDICVANRDAIVEALDAYVDALTHVRGLVAAGEAGSLLSLLERARAARRSLPVGAAAVGPIVELRVPVPDRPGVLAEVTTLASGLGVNIEDLEIAHSMEGDAGVLVLVVPEEGVEAFVAALETAGYRPSWSPLS